jgi:predicted anti-sigma-YlaC factor YlaD
MNRPIEQLSCQELVELVTSYVENALSAEERARFEEHLGVCEGCRIYVEQMAATATVAGLVQVASLSAEAEQELLRTFRSLKRS